MSTAQAADHRLHITAGLPRLETRPVRMIGQCRQSARPVLAQPVVHRLAGDPVTPGHLGNRGTGKDFHDRVTALLHDTQLHEHGPATLRRKQHHDQRATPGGRCQASDEATVSTISRSRTVSRCRGCDNFLYGFKGTPSARQRRAFSLAQGVWAGNAKCREVA